MYQLNSASEPEEEEPVHARMLPALEGEMEEDVREAEEEAIHSPTMPLIREAMEAMEEVD
jgi:predicted component of type VI protein secretion system